MLDAALPKIAIRNSGSPTPTVRNNALPTETV